MESTTETTAPSPMQELYARLSKAGIDKNYVRDVALPSWWDDDAAKTRAGFAHGAMLIARHTGLDLAPLLKPELPIRFDKSCAAPKFKKRTNTNTDEKPFATQVAVQAACMTARATKTAYQPLPETMTALRTRILDATKGPITLAALLEWCWSQGIPVIHLAPLPPHHPQALVVRVEGRPVIALCDTVPFDAKYSFWIAHELAHVIKGHLSEDGVCVDTSKSMKSRDDGEEKEANEGACELLTGDPQMHYRLTRTYQPAVFAQMVRERGQNQNVDPGVIVLNISHHQPEYIGLVTNTLKLLNPNAEPVARIRAAAKSHIDWDALTDEDAAFLQRVTGI